MTKNSTQYTYTNIYIYNPFAFKSAQFCALSEHFQAPYTYVHHEILLACRHLLIKYVPIVSEVVYRHLEVAVEGKSSVWYEHNRVISVRAYTCTYVGVPDCWEAAVGAG